MSSLGSYRAARVCATSSEGFLASSSEAKISVAGKQAVTVEQENKRMSYAIRTSNQSIIEKEFHFTTCNAIPIGDYLS